MVAVATTRLVNLSRTWGKCKRLRDNPVQVGHTSQRDDITREPSVTEVLIIRRADCL
jgi:hypothetical protein